MKKTIKAILIDAQNKQIKEVELEPTEGLGYLQRIKVRLHY